MSRPPVRSSTQVIIISLKGESAASGLAWLAITWVWSTTVMRLPSVAPPGWYPCT